MSIHKYLLLIISLIFLFSANRALAVTEFISVVDTGGAGDYSTLSAWQLNNHVDLTAATTLVFSYDASSGTIADGDPVSTDGGASTATLVHETATQILLSGISGSFDDNDVVTDGTNTVTLSNAGDSAISVASCQGSDADTAAVIIEGWDTSDTNYIKVYTTQANRHSGVWDEGKYRLEFNIANYGFNIHENYVYLEGLQIYNTNATAWGHHYDGAGEFHLSSSILRGSSGGNEDLDLRHIQSGGVVKIWNNIIYDYKRGIRGGSGDSDINTFIIYNNTFVDPTSEGIRLNGWLSSNVVYLKNNLIQGSNTNYNILNFDSYTHSNNLAEDTTSPDDAYDSKTVDFVNETGDDFHLDSTDTDAKDAGTDLSSDGDLPFSDDIDGSTRTGTWDIGADEWAIPIYRSVGPSKSTALDDDDSHTDTIAITGGTATFAGTTIEDNVGVGDVVLYDSNLDNSLTSADSIAFIKSRTDNQNYVIQTETGATPSDMSTPNDTWEIYRAYTSLSNAESGTKNTNIPIAFTGGNRDLVTNNEQWNIACYNGQGDAADETAVTIADWTTGVNNYIKVYTPMNSSEVGVTQRHGGVWDTGKYRLEFSDAWDEVIDCHVNYARIEGLQMHNSNADGYGFDYKGTDELYFSHNILQGSTGGNNSNSLYLDSMGASTVKIWNNILYDLYRGIFFDYGTAGSTFVIYNNTIVDITDDGIHINDAPDDCSVYLKNNLVFNTNDDYDVSNFTIQDYDYNMGEDAAFTGDDNYVQTSQAGTTIFKDYNNDDFHLSSSNNAKDAGTDLSSDANLSFSDDIDGDNRPSPYWDIGADEYPASRKVRFEGDFKMEGDFQIH